MFGKVNPNKAMASIALATMLASAISMLMPLCALADYAEILGGSTLRNPLVPGASYTNAWQGANQGQPPPVGDGSIPAPEIRGDMGGPIPPPSGMADPTKGNFFPERVGPGTTPPWMYVPNAGRRQTQNGQEQGVFENGQEQNGTFSGPGGKNGGTDWMNNGGPRNNADGFGPGGKNGGSDWGPGGKNGGSEWGAGGKNGGSEWSGGGKNGGSAWGPGGKNGGTGIVNNGGAAGGAAGMMGGGRSGGTGTTNNGGSNGGVGTVNNGGNPGGVGTVNNGGNAGGTGVVNNGGPGANAQGMADRMFNHQVQPNRYDYNGPLPTVRAFARYLVILGVVASTVFMGMAAWSMVMGSQYGGARVMGSAVGLCMLLAGYTIYKIVMMNTMHANSTGWESHYRNGQAQPMNGKAFNANANGGGPFGGAQNPNGGGGNNGGGNNGGGGFVNPFTANGANGGGNSPNALSNANPFNQNPFTGGGNINGPLINGANAVGNNAGGNNGGGNFGGGGNNGGGANNGGGFTNPFGGGGNQGGFPGGFPQAPLGNGG